MTRRDVLGALLERHGRTFAAEAGITLTDKPSPLFGLLVLTSLLSANLDARLGLRTALALRKAGYRTARRLAEADAHDVWQVLAEAKYLRKEQTARQLVALAGEALEKYDGDLRRLRDEVDCDPGGIRDAVSGFTGIGEVGAEIFTREVQAVWTGLRPYADQRVLDIAATLELPHTPVGLAHLAGTADLSTVGAALVRCDMAGDAAELRSLD